MLLVGYHAVNILLFLVIFVSIGLSFHNILSNTITICATKTFNLFQVVLHENMIRDDEIMRLFFFCFLFFCINVFNG